MDLERRLVLDGRTLGLSAASPRNLDSRRLGQGASRLASVAGTLAVNIFSKLTLPAHFNLRGFFLLHGKDLNSAATFAESAPRNFSDAVNGFSNFIPAKAGWRAERLFGAKILFRPGRRPDGRHRRAAAGDGAGDCVRPETGDRNFHGDHRRTFGVAARRFARADLRAGWRVRAA